MYMGFWEKKKIVTKKSDKFVRSCCCNELFCYVSTFFRIIILNTILCSTEQFFLVHGSRLLM